MLVDRNDFFYQVTVRVCSSLHLEVAMSRSLEYLEKFMPADEMYMALYDYELGIYRIIAHATKSGGRMLNELHNVSPEAMKKIETFNINETRIINDPKENPVISSLFPSPKYFDRSCLILPLTIEEKLVGVVQLFTWGKNKYSSEHAELLFTLSKPFSIALSNALEHLELATLKQQLDDENRCLREEIRENFGMEIVGKDSGLKGVFEMLKLVAPYNNPVLLLGETGTGKEVIANAIHYSSPRREGPFIKVNCGAIPETLLDSELFGHEKGSFTGAAALKRGRFERAHKGTIFLDEIGELTNEAQIRLLRVIQEKEFERVGGTESIPIDIRIISATHRDLQSMISSNRFREDLMFRINVFPITIPPLRHRKEDIPSLVHYFLERKSKEIGLRKIPKILPGAMDSFMEYSWPGNVRELQNIVERSLILCRNGVLSFDHSLPVNNNHFEPEFDADGTFTNLDDIMIKHIRTALEKTNGRINGPKGAAKLLGINPSTLRNRMKKFGIENIYI